jgi:hypothetical protein
MLREDECAKIAFRQRWNSGENLEANIRKRSAELASPVCVEKRCVLRCSEKNECTDRCPSPSRYFSLRPIGFTSDAPLAPIRGLHVKRPRFSFSSELAENHADHASRDLFLQAASSLQSSGEPNEFLPSIAALA